MQMRRTIGMTVLRLQQAPHHAVRRNGITQWPDRAKPETSRGIGGEFAPQIHRRLSLVLVLVKPGRGGVPHVNFSALYRLAILIDNLRVDEQSRSRRRRAHDAAAIFRYRRLQPPKRPQK